MAEETIRTHCQKYVDLICGKRRDGEQIDVPLVFEKRMGRFVERNREWGGGK